MGATQGSSRKGAGFGPTRVERNPTQRAARDSSRSRSEERSLDDLAIRSRAIRRSWICPGAGLALLGQRSRAMATLSMAILAVGVIPWLAFRPSPTALRTTLAIVAIACVLGLAEQISLKHATLAPPGPRLIVRHFLVASLLHWLSALGGAALLIASFGSLRVTESNMAPTVEKGERLIFHKGIGEWTRGAVVLCRNSAESVLGQPGENFLARVLAVPGDRISIDGTDYVVNGRPGPPVADPVAAETVLEVPRVPASLLVPAGCCFVVQDGEYGADSRALSWVKPGDIVSTRIWYFHGIAPLTPVR